MTLRPFTFSVALLLTTPAFAADLDSMSTAGRRIYCVAYTLIAVEAQHRSGAIDDAAYNRMRMRLGGAIQNTGDNYNYAPDFRRLDKAIQVILSEKPTAGEVAAQAQTCAPILRL